MGAVLMEFFNRIQFLRLLKICLWCGLIWSTLGYILYMHDTHLRLPHTFLFGLSLVSLLRLRNAKRVEDENQAIKYGILFLVVGLVHTYILALHTI